MNGNARNFDRWILCGALLLFGAATVYGMRIGNTSISTFGNDQFRMFSGALLLLLNRELFSNGNGNGNGKTPVAPEPEVEKKV